MKNVEVPKSIATSDSMTEVTSISTSSSQKRNRVDETVGENEKEGNGGKRGKVSS